MKLVILFFVFTLSTFTQDKKPINRHIFEVYEKSNIKTAIKSYLDLKGSNDYYFDADQLNEMGYHLISLEKLRDALEIFKLNTKEYPDNPNVYDSYAEGLATDKQYELAEAMYKKAVEMSQNSPDYIQNLSGFYRKAEMKSKEISLWKSFIEKNPTLPEAREKLIEIFYTYNETKKASDYYLKTKKNFPKYVFPQTRMELMKHGLSVIDIDDSWKIGKNKVNSKLVQELENKIADNTYKQINGIVVAYKNEIIYENYFNGSNVYSRHNTRSVGKTFASAGLSFAIKDGYIKSENELLSKFYSLKNYKNYDSKKDVVTLKDLLTMRSGFDGFDFDPSSIGNEENMYPQANWVEWALNLPMAKDRNPREKWFYFTAGAVLLGDIVDKSVPEGLEKYMDKKLFKILGINNYRWQKTPQNVANTAGGIQMSTRDFTKFGQLYKNNGRWNGQDIFSKDWAKKSTTNYVETTEKDQGYGYLLWKGAFDINGKSQTVSYASGNGGNKIYIFDDLDLVISITASAYGQSYGHSQVKEMMDKYLLKMIKF